MSQLFIEYTTYKSPFQVKLKKKVHKDRKHCIYGGRPLSFDKYKKVCYSAFAWIHQTELSQENIC